MAGDVLDSTLSLPVRVISRRPEDSSSHLPGKVAFHVLNPNYDEIASQSQSIASPTSG